MWKGTSTDAYDSSLVQYKWDGETVAYAFRLIVETLKSTSLANVICRGAVINVAVEQRWDDNVKAIRESVEERIHSIKRHRKLLVNNEPQVKGVKTHLAKHSIVLAFSGKGTLHLLTCQSALHVHSAERKKSFCCEWYVFQPINIDGHVSLTQKAVTSLNSTLRDNGIIIRELIGKRFVTASCQCYLSGKKVSLKRVAVWFRLCLTRLNVTQAKVEAHQPPSKITSLLEFQLHFWHYLDSLSKGRILQLLLVLLHPILRYMNINIESTTTGLQIGPDWFTPAKEWWTECMECVRKCCRVKPNSIQV